MDTNKIDVLLKAVENGSLLTTAGQLGYTQAGLTHMMKSLETELGITLLVRGKFGIRLTEEGQRLLPLFENLVSANEKIIREAAFQKQHPEYAFELKEGDFSIYKWFDQGRVDLCITCNILNRRDFEPLMTDEFFACLPPDYPIGENEVFPIKRFEDESYISATCGEDYDIQELLDEYDVHPKKQNTRVDDASVISMVSRGLGVSLIPKLVLDSSRADIKAVPLDMPCTRRIGIIHGKAKDMSPGMKLFIKFLKQWFQND